MSDQHSLSDERGKLREEIRQLRTKVADHEITIAELNEELAETNQGVVALYAELDDKARPIVVYCRSGKRSSRAASVLKGAGHSAVHDLGAMSRW